MQTVRVVNRILHSFSIRTSLFLINPEERNVFSKNNICRNYAGADVFYAFLMTQKNTPKLPDTTPMPYYNENSSSLSLCTCINFLQDTVANLFVVVVYKISTIIHTSDQSDLPASIS